MPPWLHVEPPEFLNLEFDADPGPAFDFDADPDSAFHSAADPDPTSKNDADPDPDPQHLTQRPRAEV